MCFIKMISKIIFDILPGRRENERNLKVRGHYICYYYIIQSLVWIGMTIFGITQFNTVDDLNDVHSSFRYMYFNVDDAVHSPFIIKPLNFYFICWLYLGGSVLWFVLSFWTLLELNRKKLISGNPIYYIWVYYTWIICIVDLIIFIIIACDFYVLIDTYPEEEITTAKSTTETITTTIKPTTKESFGPILDFIRNPFRWLYDKTDEKFLEYNAKLMGKKKCCVEYSVTTEKIDYGTCVNGIDVIYTYLETNLKNYGKWCMYAILSMMKTGVYNVLDFISAPFQWIAGIFGGGQKKRDVKCIMHKLMKKGKCPPTTTTTTTTTTEEPPPTSILELHPLWDVYTWYQAVKLPKVPIILLLVISIRAGIFWLINIITSIYFLQLHNRVNK